MTNSTITKSSNLQEEVLLFYENTLNILSESEKICYQYFGETFTYQDMWRAIKSINASLFRYKKSRVALYASKSFQTYSAIYAILLSGNTWCPLNPQHPPERNEQMLSLSKTDLILTDQDLPEIIKEFAKFNKISIVNLSEAVLQEPVDNFFIEDIDAQEIAIIYFTSGSTGLPKGVPVTHQSYIRNVNNILKILQLRTGEVFADYHDLGFIISVPILFPCILSESALVPAISKHDTILPTKSILENKVTVLISVPSTIARIRKATPNGVPNLSINVLIMCGEPFHLDLVSYCLDKLKPKALFNFYGSTEVGPWTFCHRCSKEDTNRFFQYGMAPIGKPLPGNEIMLLEDELLCAGPQITPGYLDNIDSDRFTIRDEKRWYCTGDRVVQHDDVFICKGRLDAQVKIAGYRIDLGDIETHLRRLNDVSGAVCFVLGDGEEAKIVAVLNSRYNYSLTEVRAHLKSSLPLYMMPRQLIVIDKWPLNKSGKVDRVMIRKLIKAPFNISKNKIENREPQ